MSQGLRPPGVSGGTVGTVTAEVPRAPAFLLDHAGDTPCVPLVEVGWLFPRGGQREAQGLLWGVALPEIQPGTDTSSRLFPRN